MPEDYYAYWNKKRKDDKLYNREILAKKIILRIVSGGETILDAGCGNGRFMESILKSSPNLKIKGLDFSESEIKTAREKNLDVLQADFEKGIPLSKETFDFIYAGEVIEHLFNPDFFLDELNRVLKKKGHILITTPNLCSWLNRILMPLGIQPLFLEPSTRSKLIGAGILKKFKQDSQPVGHVRIFTFEALKDLLNLSGFKILKTWGDVFEEGFPKNLLYLDRIFNYFPTVSSRFIILSKKVRNLGE